MKRTLVFKSAAAVLTIAFLVIAMTSQSQAAPAYACSASSFSASDPAVAFAPCVVPTPIPLPPRAPDDRSNWTGGDHVAVTYVRSDASGRTELDIYEVSASGSGELMLIITVAEYSGYADSPPAENMLIASAGNVAVYILTTGELQVNITEPGTGKVFVTIYNLRTLAVIGGYLINPV